MRNIFEKIAPITDEEWSSINEIFIERHFKKGEYLTEEGKTENYINLITKGACRGYFIKNGIEYNYEISLEDGWISSFKSFINRTPSNEYFQAITEVSVWSIHFDNIKDLSIINAKFGIIERHIINQIVIDKTERLHSFISDTPDERYLNLLNKKPYLVQKIPLKYLSSYIGTPESLSRLRKRLFVK